MSGGCECTREQSLVNNTRDVHLYPVYKNTSVLGSVLPVILVSAVLWYTGIFMTSVYLCSGNYLSVFFIGTFF